YQLSTSVGSVGFSISGVPSWLTASTTSGAVTTAPMTVTFTVNTSANSLAPSTYGARTSTFKSTTKGQGSTTSNATLNGAVPTPTLQLTPASDIAAAGAQGGPFAPSSFSYQLSATTGSVGFSISGVPSWLTASTTSGVVTTVPMSVTFTVNSSANGLAPGTY